jgi:hypothetical protein
VNLQIGGGNQPFVRRQEIQDLLFFIFIFMFVSFSPLGREVALKATWKIALWVKKKKNPLSLTVKVFESGKSLFNLTGNSLLWHLITLLLTTHLPHPRIEFLQLHQGRKITKCSTTNPHLHAPSSPPKENKTRGAHCIIVQIV